MFSAEEVLAAPFQDGGHNTEHRSVKCSVTISYADLDRSPGRASCDPPARQPPSVAALLSAHVLIPILLSVAVVRGWSRLLVSTDRTRSGPHRPTPTGTAGDRPAERLGDPHRDPVVDPFGRSGRDAGRCRVHGHERGAGSLEGSGPSSPGGRRPSQGSGRKAGVGVVWSDATGNARHDADPFLYEGRQG